MIPPSVTHICKWCEASLGTDTHNEMVKTLNDHRDEHVSAAWQTPYALTLPFIDEDPEPPCMLCDKVALWLSEVSYSCNHHQVDPVSVCYNHRDEAESAASRMFCADCLTAGQKSAVVLVGFTTLEGRG